MQTKQQEIDTLKKFVTSIDPNSYLGDFFQGCVPFFESAIRSDAVFAHADAIRSNEAQLRSVQAEIVEKTKKLREIEEKTTAMESRMLYAERQLQSMKDSSSKLFNEIRSKIDSVEYAVTLFDVFCGEGLKHYHKINRMLREACDELNIPYMNMS